MKTVFTEKVKVYVNEKYKNKTLDHYKIIRACVFFIHDHFALHYNKFDKIHIQFLDNKEYLVGNSSTGNGCCNVFNNDIYCNVNVEVLKKYKHIFPKPLKSMFLVLLHEIGHALDVLKKARKGQNLEKIHIKNIVQREKILAKGIDECEKSILYSTLPDEIFASQFAYKNLAYFENLYATEEYLI